MARYRCHRCHEITYRPEPVAFCGICSAPLSAANLEPEDSHALRTRSLQSAGSSDSQAEERPG